MSVNSMPPQKNEPLKKEMAALKTAFELLKDHVVITDPEGIILYANKAAADATGFSKEEMIGKKPSQLYGNHMDRQFYERMWHTIKNEKKPFVGEVKNVAKNGVEYWQELHITPVLDAADNVRFFIGIEPIITEKKLREQLREEFISVVGHQLKNPLVAIRWALEWLGESAALTAEQKEALGVAYSGNKALIDLVADLLTVSRIEKNHLEKVEKDIRPTIAAAVHHAQATYGSVTFSFTAPETPTMVALANKMLSEEIFANILSNAAMYGVSSDPTVTITLTDDGTEYVFSCKDNGIGIPAGEQSKVFSRFFRGSNAANVKKIGSGLGLFIVKLACDLLGWTVSFHSKEGEGTEFFVRMPKA